MTIAKLTEDEQATWELHHPAALRIIDAQAARIAELEARRGDWAKAEAEANDRADAALARAEAAERRANCAEANEALHRADRKVAESEAATLRAENERLRFLEELTSITAAEWTRIRASLAAANTLLGRWVQSRDFNYGESAVHAETVRHLARQPAAPTRTEVDQAVLDAMREIPEHALEYWRVHGTVMQSNVAVAELARRGLKP